MYKDLNCHKTQLTLTSQCRVRVCVHPALCNFLENSKYLVYIFTNPSGRAGYDTRSIFWAEFNRFEFRVFLLD